MANELNTTVTAACDLAPAAELIELYKGKSGAIRWMTAQGYTRSQIAAHLDIRYQHVRNVQMQPLKKQG